MAGTMTTDDLYALVRQLAAGEREAAVTRLRELVATDRPGLEEVRKLLAARLHGHSDDFTATAALTVLNRALADTAPTDPMDWKERWARGRKP